MWGFLFFILFPLVVWAEEVTLPEVVITATKTPHLLKEVPVETLIISRREIERSNALTISELLRDIPGFFVRAENLPGISAWRTRLRGFDLNSGYALILVDGERVKGGGMGEYGYGLNQIPPALIERIEIVKGPGSVLYGSDAVTGVINIITRKVPSQSYVEGLARYGTYQTKMFNLTGGGPIFHNKVGLLLSLDREETDRRKYGGPGDHYKRDHLFSKISFNLTPNADLNFTLKWEDRDRNFANEEKLRLSPQINYQLKNINITLKGYYYKWNFHHFTPGYTERQGHMYYHQGECKISFPIKSHSLTVGGEFLEERLDYNLAKKTIDTKSFYLQDEFSLNNFGKTFTYLFGIRIDDHSVFGTEISPRLSLMVNLSETSRIRALIGRSFKSPTIRQLYYRRPFLHHDYWIKSNPNLDAETSWGESLSFEKILPHNFSLLLTMFRHDLDDMVVRVETEEEISGYPVETYKNVQEAYTEGLEFSLKGSPLPEFTFNVNYTYLYTKNKDTHKELPYCPKHTIGLKFDFKFPHNFLLRIKTEYMDKVYKNTTNTKKIDSYWLTSTKVIKSFQHKLEAFMEIDNIFDTNYGEPSRNWAGRTIFVGIRSKFY